MRSIGAKNINMIKKMIGYEIKRSYTFSPFTSVDYSAVKAEVMSRIPDSVFDTWESAHAQINNIIDDELSALARER